MNAIPDFGFIAGLIADQSRSKMLAALLGGVALPANELARHAKISPQTASSHLAKLVQGGLVSVTASGRHRYFRLSNAQVAQALESLSLIAPPQPVRGLRDSLESQAICAARTCYDHLAGWLGVAMSDALINQQVLEQSADAYTVSEQGEHWFMAFGIDCQILRKQRRAFAPACLDWSERRSHLAGSLGAAMTRQLFERRWIGPVSGSRAVKVTDSGRLHLSREFGLEFL
jgi:DNA-binding transcriptional ArsR family regulator